MKPLSSTPPTGPRTAQDPGSLSPSSPHPGSGHRASPSSTAPRPEGGLLTGALVLALEPGWVDGDVHSLAHSLSPGEKRGIWWSSSLPVSQPLGTSEVPWLRSQVSAGVSWLPRLQRSSSWGTGLEGRSQEPASSLLLEWRQTSRKEWDPVCPWLGAPGPWVGTRSWLSLVTGLHT